MITDPTLRPLPLYTLGMFRPPGCSEPVDLLLVGPQDYELAKAQADAAVADAGGDIEAAFQLLRRTDGWGRADRIRIVNVPTVEYEAVAVVCSECGRKWVWMASECSNASGATGCNGHAVPNDPRFTIITTPGGDGGAKEGGEK